MKGNAPRVHVGVFPQVVFVYTLTSSASRLAGVKRIKAPMSSGLLCGCGDHRCLKKWCVFLTKAVHGVEFFWGRKNGGRFFVLKKNNPDRSDLPVFDTRDSRTVPLGILHRSGRFGVFFRGTKTNGAAPFGTAPLLRSECVPPLPGFVSLFQKKHRKEWHQDNGHCEVDSCSGHAASGMNSPNGARSITSAIISNASMLSFILVSEPRCPIAPVVVVSPSQVRTDSGRSLL